MDSNHIKKINSLLCYRYTKEQNYDKPRNWTKRAVNEAYVFKLSQKWWAI